MVRTLVLIWLQVSLSYAHLRRSFSPFNAEDFDWDESKWSACKGNGKGNKAKAYRVYLAHTQDKKGKKGWTCVPITVETKTMGDGKFIAAGT